MYYTESPSFLGFKSLGSLRNYLRQYAMMNNFRIPYHQIFKQVTSKPVKLCKIQNIKEPYYSKLNGSLAFVLSMGKDGITIASKHNIKLPYKYTPNQPVFSYGGVLKAKSQKTYWRYTLPRENVFGVNLCAIAYSVGIKPRTYMQCHKLLGVDGNFLYLQIVEYSNRTVANKNIVSVYNSFAQAQHEVVSVIDTLVSEGFLIDKNVYMESFEGELIPSVEETPMLAQRPEDFI